MKSKPPKGVIVWDFDGVLFLTQKQSLENRRLLGELGISEKRIIEVLARLKKQGGVFSVTGFIKELNRPKKSFSALKVRKVFHDNLVVNNYYDPKVDRMLHKLKRKGFVQMILSMGDAKFQRKKMFIGCSASFRNHFVRIYTTLRPKFLTLARIKKHFSGSRIIFVDDTEENLELVRKHIPEIATIYYSNISGHSLQNLEKQILHAAKTKN